MTISETANETLTLEDVERLERLLELATTAPWIHDEEAWLSIWSKCAPSGCGTAGPLIARVVGDSAEAEANANLIVNLRNTAPALLSLARAQLEAQETEDEKWARRSDEQKAVYDAAKEAREGDAGQAASKLRDLIPATFEKDGDGYYDTELTIAVREAADLITAQAAEIARLWEALKPFADAANSYEGHYEFLGDEVAATLGFRKITVKNLRDARAAIGKGEAK